MKASRAVFLGFAVPDAFAEELFRVDPIPAVQTHKFAWAFAKVLGKVFDHVILMSAAPVQPYPVTPCRSFSEREFEENGKQGVIMGASNARLMRHVSRFVACLRMTGRLRREWRPDAVFVHGVHSPFLLYALFLRLFGIKAFVVLTDGPGIMLATDGRLRRVLKLVDRFVVRLLLKGMTGVVALAPALAAELARGKPALIFPGIISDDWAAAVALRGPEIPGFTVTYAGGIEANYGAALLVGAARMSPETTFRLCGKGHYADEARLSAPANVVFPGFLGQDAVANELLAASLLINPRPTSSEFSARSFPSKLLEYLATGRPVMTTRIASIPAELVGSFYYIDDETPEGVARAIAGVAALPLEERRRFGAAARQTALDNFGEAAVAKKLLDSLAGF